MPRFGAANAGDLLFGVGFAIMLLSNVLWCQDVWHYSPLRTGVAMAPGPALVPVVTVLSARAVHRFGTGRWSPSVRCCSPAACCGGQVFVAARRLPGRPAAQHGARRHRRRAGARHPDRGRGHLAAGRRSATGSAMVNAGRQIAAAVGVAMLVTILGARVSAGSVDDFRAAWLLGAVLSLGTALVGVRLSRKQRVPAVAVPAPAA